MRPHCVTMPTVEPSSPATDRRFPRGTPQLVALAAVIALVGMEAASASALTRGTVTGVSCPSVSLCVAVDANGNVFATNKPAGGPLAWSAVHVSTSPRGFTDVSCALPSFCAAVDGSGNVFTSSDPTGPKGLWPVEHVDDTLVSVACPSAGLCVAAGGEPALAASQNPAGGSGAWTGADPHFGPDGEYVAGFSHLACPSVSLCVAVGSNGSNAVSTNPTGGAAAWTFSSSIGPAVQITSLACPSVSLCVAVGLDAVTTGNPIADTWTTVKKVSPDYLRNLSCPSPVFCAATDLEGTVTSSDPTGGPRAWGRPASLSPLSEYQPTSLACPSVTLCVMGNVDGYLLISTHPTGSAKDWKVTYAGPSQIGAVSVGHPTVSGTVATMYVGCGGTGSVHCKVSAVMTATSHTKHVTVGSATMTLDNMTPKAHLLRVGLNRAGRRLLAARHRLSVSLAIAKTRFNLTFRLR